MRKEAKLLLGKAINSLTLGVEHFNRPWDQGRVEAVLILLDHSFEMLLKASILHRGGKIREPRAKQTIGFDSCVRKALSDAKIQFLSKEQTLLLQSINSLRDAAQHHLLDISEQHLYIHAQAGLSLFRDILSKVFGQDLQLHLPTRVLPLSTSPPTDLASLFDHEVKEIKRLLQPGKRHRVEATAKLRSLAIMEGAVKGERLQPSQGDLNKLGEQIRDGKAWDSIFPGVASINITATGHGPSLDLRITKKAGVPVQMVPEGTPGAAVVAVKRVDELGFYSLGRDQLAEKVGLSGPKTTAMVWFLNLQSDTDCHKEITIGKSKFHRYSQKAIERIREELEKTPIDKVWDDYSKSKAQPRRKK